MLCLSGFELYSRWVPLLKGNSSSVFADTVPQGKRRSCHSIRFGFKLSSYTFINNEKTSILRLLERVLLRIPSN